MKIREIVEDTGMKKEQVYRSVYHLKAMKLVKIEKKWDFSEQTPRSEIIVKPNPHQEKIIRRALQYGGY